MKLPIGYPSPDEEQEIIRRYGKASRVPEVSAVIDEEAILAARDAIETHVHVEDAIIQTVQRMVDETRPERSTIAMVAELVEQGGGASPRAGIGIVYAARVNAVMQGRDYVTPDDLVAVVTPILRHRIVFKPGEVQEEEAEQRLIEIVEQIVRAVL